MRRQGAVAAAAAAAAEARFYELPAAAAAERDLHVRLLDTVHVERQAMRDRLRVVKTVLVEEKVVVYVSECHEAIHRDLASLERCATATRPGGRRASAPTARPRRRQRRRGCIRRLRQLAVVAAAAIAEAARRATSERTRWSGA
jgi:hypothetical protein